MRKLLLPALVALSLSIVGCSSAPQAKPDKFVGHWNTNINGAPATANFEPDGSMKMAIVVKTFQDLHVDLIGKWRDKGDQLFITVADATASNFPPQMKGHEQEFTDAMKKSMEIGKEEGGTVKWEGDDKFEISRNGNSTAFTRAKG